MDPLVRGADTDPDPAPTPDPSIFGSDYQEGNKKEIKNKIFCLLLFEDTFIKFSEDIKS